MSDRNIPSNLVAAARELLRLKDLKTDAEAMETSGSWSAVHRRNAMLAEHEAKKGEAWHALRRALQDETPTDALPASDRNTIIDAMSYARDYVTRWKGAGNSGNAQYTLDRLQKMLERTAVKTTPNTKSGEPNV